MALVEVDAVSVNPDLSDVAHHFELTSPKPGTTSNIYGLTFQGSFVAAQDGVKQLRLRTGRGAIPVPLNIDRPEIASSFSEIKWAVNSGFSTTLGAVSFPRQFDVQLMAPFPGRVVRLASVRCHRKALPPVEKTRFKPIVLTTLPRTGGTWVTHVLGQHPGILALRPFQFEGRIATYWMDIFAALAEPKSFYQCLQAEVVGRHWWLGGTNLAPEPAKANTPGIVQWLGSENVEALLGLFHGRVQESYAQIAAIEGKADASFFIERCEPYAIAQSLLSEVYPDTREIVLVRDFRDMAASMLAYNRKRGFQFFGRDAAGSDEQHIARYGRLASHLLQAWKDRADRSFLLRYEDLIRNPEDTLEGLLSYLGLNAERELIDQMLSNAIKAASGDQEVHRTTTTADASIGRWRNDLDEPLREACEEAFGESLASLGY